MLNLSMPMRTFVPCGLAALASVLLISWLRIRPIGVYCLVILGYWFYKTQCNSRLVPPPELKKKLDQTMDRLREVRENHPRMFCGVMCFSLTALAILGHYISGSTVVLVGLGLAAIMSTKYNFKLVTIEHNDFAWSREVHGFDVAEPDDEFMPEVNETNLFVLERASDLATISSPTEDADDDEEKSDEIPSELLIPDSIPEIDENSSEDDEEDLVPIITNKSADNAAASTVQELVFKKRHFKSSSSLSNTSSSSEESLSKGLHFPDHTVVDGPAKRRLTAATAAPPPAAPSNQAAENLLALAVQSQTQSLLANSGKLLPSLVSGLVQWGMSGAVGSSGGVSASPKVDRRMVTALDSSDDSDFEILETDDFK